MKKQKKKDHNPRNNFFRFGVEEKKMHWSQCFVSLHKILLVLVLLGPLAVKCNPPVCSGPCASTYFSTTTSAICDSVEVTITGKDAASCLNTIHGGDVYVFSNDMECAAVHRGVVAAGGTMDVKLYFMGTRPSRDSMGAFPWRLG